MERPIGSGGDSHESLWLSEMGQQVLQCRPQIQCHFKLHRPGSMARCKLMSLVTNSGKRYPALNVAGGGGEVHGEVLGVKRGDQRSELRGEIPGAQSRTSWESTHRAPG